MSGWGGFWVMWGLVALGFCVDNGLCAVGRALAGEKLRPRKPADGGGAKDG